MMIRMGLIFLLALLLGCGGTSQAAEQTLLYLGWDGANRVQIFERDLAGETRQQLTEETAVILTYAVSSQGDIVYVAVGEERDGLWLLPANGRSARQILACSPTLSCDHPVWHPDGERLLYERDDLTNVELPALFWLDVSSGETMSLNESANVYARAATFSPNGEWVSYYAVADNEIQAFHFGNQQQLRLNSQTGHPANWHPQGSQIIFNNYHLDIFHGDDGTNHDEHSHVFEEMIRLYRMDVDNGRFEPLSEATGVADMQPVWSPDGEWIAFLRGTAKAASGQQIWRIRPDGTGEEPLTNDLRYQHGAVSWSANCRLLIYQAFDTLSSDPNAKPAVWQLNVETGEARQITTNAFLPQWRPSP